MPYFSGLFNVGPAEARGSAPLIQTANKLNEAFEELLRSAPHDYDGSPDFSVVSVRLLT